MPRSYPTSTAGRVALAAFGAILARLLVQPLLPSEENDLLPPSWIVEQGLLPPAFFAYGMLVYGALGATYVGLDPPGHGLRRGLAFGSLFIAMWASLLLEPLPHSEGAGWVSLVGYPLADAFGLFVLGALLGWLLPTPRRAMAVAAPSPGRRLRDALVVGAVYLAVRSASAATLPLYTWFEEHPALSTAWAALTGVCFGGIFSVCRPWLAPGPGRVAASFAFGVIGANLLLFNGFLLLVARVDPLDLLARTALDLAALGLGAWIAASRAASRGLPDPGSPARSPATAQEPATFKATGARGDRSLTNRDGPEMAFVEKQYAQTTACAPTSHRAILAGRVMRPPTPRSSETAKP